MRHLRRLIAGATAGLSLLALAACASSGSSSGASSQSNASGRGAIAPQNVITVEVENNNPSQMTLHAVYGGQSTRIGQVRGLDRTTIRLDGSLYPSGEITILGDPIGQTGQASTGRLIARPGQKIVFRIATNLSQSTASVQ